MKKKKTPLQIQWDKEIRRVKSFIKRAGKRGYNVDYQIPEQPKRITKQALQELRSETTAPKLYKSSTYITREGEIITGTQARNLERKISAEKGKETRRRNKLTPQQKYDEFKSKKNKQSLEKRYETREEDLFLTPYPSFSTEVIENLRNELSKWHTLSRKELSSVSPHWRQLYSQRFDSATLLLDLLETAVETEGERRVALRLETNASVINDALQEFNLSSRQESVRDATVRIANIIKGTSLTMEESSWLTELAESNQ